ncbi:30S ribosomal protein S20 [Candidatus Woesebacteria bacterium]|nr:30S ribosomal protein S20 [Candidatus Woesebacteria bacterium]
MPITKSALKALRQSDRRTETNRPIRSRVKTSIDKLNETKTPDALSTAFSAIDKALKRNLLHRNKAARLKSKLSKVLSSK